MSRQEKLDRCALLVQEIKEMEESKVLNLVKCCPEGMFSGWPSGMPRGTNRPEMAVLQRCDVNDAIDQLDARCEELLDLLDELGIDI